MTVTVRKWLEIARFELGYQLRRKSLWFFFGVYLLMLIGQTNGAALEAVSRKVPYNAPLFVAQHVVMMGLFALMVLAPLAGDAATRDVQTRIEPLLHAAPIRRAAYLGGRFTGAFAAAALLLAVVPLAFLVAAYVHPDLPPELVGPFRGSTYLRAYLLLTFPNALLAMAVLFGAAVLVRHTVASYLGGVLLIVATAFVNGFLAGSWNRWDVAQWVDPMGIAVLRLMSKTWSPTDLATRVLGAEGMLLANRLVMVATASAVLAFTYARFRFGVSARRVRRIRATANEPAANETRSVPAVAPDAPRNFRIAGRIRQTLTIARDSLREMFTGWMWVVLPFIALQVAINDAVLEVNGTPIIPATERVLWTLQKMLNTVFVFAVLFAGELVWRERDANMQSLADTAPAPDRVRFTGKLLGLWGFVVALHGLVLLIGVLTQVQRGHFDFDFGLYLQILFGLELIESLTFALLALSVHVLVNHKHVGHVVMLVLVLAVGELTSTFGIEHPLLIYGSTANWRYSAISGFGPYAGPVLWFASYWAAWTLLVALVAGLFAVRGVELRFRERLRIARRRLTGRTAGALAASSALVLLLGGFLFYNTNILNEWRTSAASANRQAEYERRYKRHEAAPLPALTSTELEVELHPERREARVRGVHQLVNRTARPIDAIHVAVSAVDDVETDAIELDRPARATLVDDELGYRMYTLARPLQPGESLRMTWSLRYEPRGFAAHDLDTSVVRNGTFLVMHQWMPMLGYQRSRELSDKGVRKAHGLPERVDVAPLDDVTERNKPLDRVLVKTVIGTAGDQIAVAPGELRREWTSGGRRYFEYATGHPIGLGYAIFSARYAVRKAQWNGVAIEVFHHPEHDRNVSRMVRGMEASLVQFSKRFGPYPHESLRMIEYPSEGGSLHAASANIWYQELFSLFDAEENERQIDMPFAVTAHEVAHQWWGGKVSPARVEGVGLLSESLAWYSAMGVIEAQYGEEHLQRFLAFMRDAYLDPRARADVPLLRTTDWFQSYRKGPFAMNALREYVGEERVDAALRALQSKFGSGEPPLATSRDLYRELQAVTPQSLHGLLGDLFERNTFWELKAVKTTAQPIANGAWQVSLEFSANKVVVDEKGKEKSVPMNDLVEIGVFAPPEAGQMRGKPLHLAMHRVRTGMQTITLIVPRKPASAGIDPRNLLIDAEPDDNVVVAAHPRGASGGRATGPDPLVGPASTATVAQVPPKSRFIRSMFRSSQSVSHNAARIARLKDRTAATELRPPIRRKGASRTSIKSGSSRNLMLTPILSGRHAERGHEASVERLPGAERGRVRNLNG